jgi:hypothetical protein
VATGLSVYKAQTLSLLQLQQSPKADREFKFLKWPPFAKGNSRRANQSLWSKSKSQRIWYSQTPTLRQKQTQRKLST